MKRHVAVVGLSLQAALVGCSSSRFGRETSSLTQSSAKPLVAKVNDKAEPTANTTQTEHTQLVSYNTSKSTNAPSFIAPSTSSDADGLVRLAELPLNRSELVPNKELPAETENVLGQFVSDPITSLAGTETDNQPTTIGADHLSLEEVLGLAFTSNPSIKELAATTQKAAGYRTQVGLYANPVIGYSGQQLVDKRTDQHIAFIEQEFVTGGKLQLNRQVLNEALRAQLHELEAQKFRVATDIKTTFYESLQYQEQLDSITAFSALMKKGVEAAQQRMKAGEGTKVDLLQTSVQLQQLELSRRQIAASLEADLRKLMTYAGLPHMNLSGVRGELPHQPNEHDWKSLGDTLVQLSPEYAAAQARICQAHAALVRQQAQPIPNLLVSSGAGYDNGTQSGMINLQAGVPYPLFNKNQGNIAAARADYCVAVQDAQRIDNDIRARLATVSGEYAMAAAAVNMYNQELIPAAQETLDLTEKAYRAGEQEFLQLLIVRRTYFDTRLAFTAAKAQLAVAQSKIDGYLLTGALNSVIDGSGDDSLRGATFGQQ